MRLTTTLLALTLIAGSSLAARADEKLPPDQQAKVEAMLKQEGFTKWKEIELDDGMIEVAIRAVEAVFDWRNYINENFGTGGIESGVTP